MCRSQNNSSPTDLALQKILKEILKAEKNGNR